jgi:hypothetical protein
MTSYFVFLLSANFFIIPASLNKFFTVSEGIAPVFNHFNATSLSIFRVA